MVVAVVPYLFGLVGLTVISREQSARRALRNVDADLARFSDADGFALGGEDIDFIYGRGLAHRSDLEFVSDKISDDLRRFGLPEAVHYLQSR